VFIGTGGLNPTLTIKEGATFIYNKPSSGLVGVGLQQTSNGLLTVTDPGSSLSTTGALQVGSNNDPGNADMFNNQVKVLNAATLTANRVQVGILESGKQNTVTVSGPDSKMNLTGEGAEAPIGWRSINNTLFVDKGGLIDGGNSFVLGIESTSTGNAATIASGGRVNGTGFEVRRGTLTISEGSLYLRQFFDSLNMIYTGGAFVSNVGSNGFVDFNSGTVEAVSAEFNKALTVGDGGGISATYHMVKDATGANGTHSFSGGLVLSSNAILEGSGNIAGGVSGSPGARVVVGTSPGLINALNDWSNIGLAVDLEVGDFRSLPAVAGVGYDQLDVVGSFTHGGSLAIDVSSYINGSGPLMDLKLVGWGSQIGNSADTAVAFIGGPALAYEFRADGFYLTDVAVVPEPATVVLLAGCLGIGFLRRPRIAVTN